ncbi:MAG: NnrU family protein [Marinovum algicola]|uniref:NnrU protein n=2 Tax=Roseobacteraceae TaxID=2854170 RepID=A0A975W9P2_9RHOB|nr:MULTISPECIES: NnrU family protein [Marinovum]MDD9741811.1 NnrU family protein [Marinovum sp. SP66]SEJ39705.1 NnrU protein [Marinovum algicola]SLN40634.1 NnrU protein [Marinovum algicola]
MFLLVLGLALWALAHFFKRLLPARRAAMGDKGKGAVALALVVSVVLMVLGYRAAPFVDVWYPPEWARHLNNLMVLIALFMMSPAPKKGRLLSGMRHPMLMGFGLWALAHLLVNGDVASIVLFGGLLVWATAEILVINRAEPRWVAPAPGSYGKDAMFFLASIVLLGVIGYIHGLIGPSPFPG